MQMLFFSNDVLYHKQMETRPEFSRSVTLPVLNNKDNTTSRQCFSAKRISKLEPERKRRRNPLEPKIKLPPFNALNRSFEPIPTYLEGKDDIKRNYGRKNIEFWENQIKK